MRITKHRQTIISLLENLKQPMSAEMIMQELPKNMMDLSTIYRTLDRLYLSETVSKSMINNTAYYYLNQKEHHHYMICIHCKQLFELDCHINEITNQIETDNDFKIIHHDLTFHGYCSDCKPNSLHQ